MTLLISGCVCRAESSATGLRVVLRCSNGISGLGWTGGERLETENRRRLEQRAIAFCKGTEPFRSLKTHGSDSFIERKANGGIPVLCSLF